MNSTFQLPQQSIWRRRRWWWWCRDVGFYTIQKLACNKIKNQMPRQIAAAGWHDSMTLAVQKHLFLCKYDHSKTYIIEQNRTKSYD